MYNEYHAQSVQEIRLSSGKVVPFELNLVKQAARRALQATAEGQNREAQEVAEFVLKELFNIKKHFKTFIPDVEGVQDLIESALITLRYVNTAKNFILQREEKRNLRRKCTFKKAGSSQSNQVDALLSGDPVAQMTHLKHCAAWIPETHCKETWSQTVSRYVDFMSSRLQGKIEPQELKEIHDAILNRDILPSVALLRAAGRAATATNVCAYDNAYVAPTRIADFAEMMYILMCGPALTFSVEQENLHQLPQIKRQTGIVLPCFEVEDDKESWCDALRAGMEVWYEGKDLKFDYGRCRSAGRRLKTLGGKSSGPEALSSILNYVRDKVLSRQGARLQSLDVFDIVCKIKENVILVSDPGSDMLALSDLHDFSIRDCKKGSAIREESHRRLCRNAVVYAEPVRSESFLEEWIEMMSDGLGERQVFNRFASYRRLPERRRSFFIQKGEIINERPVALLGMSVWGELLLRPKQFGSTTFAVAREGDSMSDLHRKIRLATIIATYQATFDEFPYLSSEWGANCRAESLLGVGLFNDQNIAGEVGLENLTSLKKECVETNRRWSQKLGVEESLCSTILANNPVARALLNRHLVEAETKNREYGKPISLAPTDPILELLRSRRIEMQQDESDNLNPWFLKVLVPLQAEERDSVVSLKGLHERWKLVIEHFAEHPARLDFYLRGDDWVEMAAWVFENWESLGGVTAHCIEQQKQLGLIVTAVDREYHCARRKQFADINLLQEAHFEELEA